MNVDEHGLEEQAPFQNGDSRFSLIFERLLWVAVLLVAFGVAASFLGRLHWIFELASHFRVQMISITAVFAFVAIAIRDMRMVAVLGVALAANLTVVMPDFFPVTRNPNSGTAGETVRIVSANVLTSNESRRETVSYLKSLKADILIGVETDQNWHLELLSLESQFPFSVHETFQGNFGITLLSRIELKNSRIEWVGDPAVPAIFAEVQTESPFTIVAAHVVPPGSQDRLDERQSQLGGLVELIKKETLPVVMLGDLNLTPYSYCFSDFLDQTQLVDSRKGFGVQPTWPTGKFVLQIPIDHCLVDERIAVRSRFVGECQGSDHFPVVVELELPPNN